MIRIDYYKNISCPFSAADITTVAKIAAKHEKKIAGTVEVTMVGDKEIQELNKQYRGLNKVTDVLSFAWEEDSVVPSSLLGQIYISYPQIKRQAKDFKCTPEEECLRMLVHGLLHIVGFDHIVPKDANKMFPLQEKIVVEAKRKLSL